MINNLNNYIAMAFVSILTTVSITSHAAVTLDRTRIIFPGDTKSVNVTIVNDSDELPYLAQSWVEDMQGHKLTKGPILATPPLQRLEPKSKSLVRLSLTPESSSLAQDRESVFYFNLREVPPKSDNANTLQIALQSKVKLFYRPEATLTEAETKWPHRITLTKTESGYTLNNPTPFHLTIIGFGKSQNDAETGQFEAVMVAPKSSWKLKSANFQNPYLTYIDDYGGKPTLSFKCQALTCTVVSEL